MATYSWLVTGLATFDVTICVVLYFVMRSANNLNRSVLLPLGAGMIGFAVHALMFFDGVFQAVQLSTLAVLFGIVWMEVQRRRPTTK